MARLKRVRHKYAVNLSSILREKKRKRNMEKKKGKIIIV